MEDEECLYKEDSHREKDSGEEEEMSGDVVSNGSEEGEDEDEEM